MNIAEEIPTDKHFSYLHCESFIRGCYLYQLIWAHVVRERYSGLREIDNTLDKHAIANVTEERAVGNTPICVSKFLN